MDHFEISENEAEDYQKQFKKNKITILVLLTLFVIVTSYEIFRYVYVIRDSDVMFNFPFWIFVFPILFFVWIVIPIQKFYQSIQIIYQYEFDDKKFSLETITGKIIETEKNNVMETIDRFSYYGADYKAKKIVINGKSYYFPLENMNTED